MRQIILDTETTGLDPQKGHRLIEIGCLEMIDRRLTGESFHCYINPQREVEPGAFSVHGISTRFLADKPLFADIYEEFLTFVRHADIIIHNAPFDVGFINHELGLLKKKVGRLEDYASIIDTLVLARQLHPGQKNNLDALCKRYSVDNANRDLHGALIDSELLAQVYLLMTGGQATLFGEQKATQTAEQTAEAIQRVASDRPPLRVIQATEEELAAHEAYMKQLTVDVKT